MNMHPLLTSLIVVAFGCASTSFARSNKASFTELTIARYDLQGNKYCDNARRSDLLHVLQTGTFVSDVDIHDNYSSVGCTAEGSVRIDGHKLDFRFEYGGVFYFSDGRKFGCGKACCRDSFKYCTWTENGG